MRTRERSQPPLYPHQSCRLHTRAVQPSRARVAELTCALRAGSGFSFEVPSRAKGNQHYVPELDRIVLKDTLSKRAFASLATSRKAVITARVLSLVHELARKRIHVTKRDLFYTDVNLFEDQNQSDAVLDDASCMLGCTRASLHVVASEKGVVVGRLRFREDGDLIDCQRMGVGGKAIPPNTDKVRRGPLRLQVAMMGISALSGWVSASCRLQVSPAASSHALLLKAAMLGCTDGMHTVGDEKAGCHMR